MSEKEEYLMQDEEPKRVYYGNVCNRCFSSHNLFKCKCDAVQYCSVRHQEEDRRVHKRVCPLLKTRKMPPNLDGKGFFAIKYQYMLLTERAFRPHALTDWEKEIFLVPWVCAVCYSQENLDIGCGSCKSVAYCSLEHKLQDTSKHNVMCKSLYTCRVFSSLGYKNGYKIPVIKFNYQAIRQGERHFPECMNDLLKLLQKEVRNPKNDLESLNLRVFGDRYSAAATILSCLEKIGAMKNRKFNWLPGKDLTPPSGSNPGSKSKLSAPLVIHFVEAGQYELELKWPNFVGLFLDWLINVNKIKIVLVGRELVNCKPPNFDAISQLASCEVYESDYNEVVDRIEKPDVVVLYNFGYPKVWGLEELITLNRAKYMFKYSKVPVIVTSPFNTVLEQVAINVRQIEHCEVACGISQNKFSDNRSFRFWGADGMICPYYNQYTTVFRKK